MFENIIILAMFPAMIAVMGLAVYFSTDRMNDKYHEEKSFRHYLLRKFPILKKFKHHNHKQDSENHYYPLT